MLASAAKIPGGGTKAFIIADARLKAQTRELERALKRQAMQVATRYVEASEQFKDINKIYPLYGWLLENGADRKSVLYAVGGGTIGDAAGFLAATFLRGIRWVGVPTTFLAQVDSAIGGKTGINHVMGKNLIGAFYQPAKVVCEISFLKSLPERDRVSGLGEMVKYGLIYDPKLFASVERDWRKVLRLEPASATAAVARCAKLKAQAVSRDEFDRKGVREVLNFGHTIGHALESATDYKVFRHGEAVIYGMRAAALISVLRGHLAPEAQDRIESLLGQLPVPEIPSRIKSRDLLKLLKFDKKAEAGRVRFVLLKRIGATVLDRAVTDEEALAAIEGIRS